MFSIYYWNSFKYKIMKESDQILQQNTIDESKQITGADFSRMEKRNRELEIEVALERIRAWAMAMHNSEELAEVAAILFKHLRELGGELFECGAVLYDWIILWSYRRWES